MALVDYWGYRYENEAVFFFSLRLCLPFSASSHSASLVASAVLPLDNNSLVYGSDDGGGSVQCNPSVVKEMDSLGAALNLRKHTIAHCHVQLATCADIEVHYCSFQGAYKYYCIDNTRGMEIDVIIVAVFVSPLSCASYLLM
jgi:hypothetical protein